MALDQQLVGSSAPHKQLANVKVISSRSDKPVEWNTSNLGLRIGADAASAATASALVAPIICVIDRSIVSKAATNRPLSQCLAEAIKPAFFKPHQFLTSRPFILIFSLYFSTYMTANTVDTITSTVRSQSPDKITSSTSKFLATSAVNMTMCVYKDSQFARMFSAVGSSSSGPAAAIPKLSYALFAARDSCTIFASFNLPPILSQRLKNLPDPVQHRFSRLLSTDNARANTAQFIAPALVQLFSTPLHLLGLDLYNRQQKLGAGQRFTRVCRDWAVSAFARMGRIIPAFGVGGVVNAQMRRGVMQRIDR